MVNIYLNHSITFRSCKALIEILDIEIDDAFFREISNSYKEKSIKISVVNVELS